MSKNAFMNNVLVLGASGLLGRSLVRYLKTNGHKVGALSRSLIKNDIGVRAYNVDVLIYEDLEPIVAQYDTVINCIGQITSPISECVILNTKGIQNIIDAVKKNKNYLIHISTVSVYGSLFEAKEDTLVNPESIYGALKYSCECQISYGLTNYSILRVCNLYGRGQDKGILAYLVRTMKSGERTMTFNNNGTLKRYYLHIDDFSDVIMRTVQEEIKGVFNIIGNDFMTIKNLVALYEDLMDYSFNVSYENKIPIENIEKIDDSKLKNRIGHVSKNSITSYLQEQR